MSERKTLPASATAPLKHWVQTERATHEEWGKLIAKSPLAARILHTFAARVGDHNAVVISQPTLARILGASENGVRKALKILERGNWIEVRQIGPSSTNAAYVLNDRVVWWQARDRLRVSLFSAVVIANAEEQRDQDSLDDPHNPPLKRLPAITDPLEAQLPTGDGLAPPSQPYFQGLEPDLPAINPKPSDAEILAVRREIEAKK
jgi:hypothetical protein